MHGLCMGYAPVHGLCMGYAPVHGQCPSLRQVRTAGPLARSQTHGQAHAQVLPLLQPV